MEELRVIWAFAILIFVLCYSYYVQVEYFDNKQEISNKNSSYEIPQELNKYNYSIVIKNVVGEYYSSDYKISKDSIIIYSGNTNTIVHEIGHRIWYQILNETIKAEFQNLSNNIISDYAGVSVAEDFAETFECYYAKNVLIKKEGSTMVLSDCKNYLNKTSPDRFLFIEKYKVVWE